MFRNTNIYNPYFFSKSQDDFNKKMYLEVKNKHGLFSFPSRKLDDIKIVEELANDINTALQITTDWE